VLSAGGKEIGLLCFSSLQVLKRLCYTWKERAIFRGDIAPVQEKANYSFRMK